ncbi:DUF6193 family natural product biosynthesis protein [Streptomyces sp. NBC_00536]|uniref:DUF6193 family natural product biosynthesis protein n=1 Tax=Streptomyces sp. NBC_00536 TaxID=2975769 RepID=UPI002E821053|nr:DUF6193 family natural product biosynthesis protein [Streptomyces sp. NBC_00536]WUC83221.1 DUF6193 family natural product biosynthesis protein [Streptomyces sp. NBC_00536]
MADPDAASPAGLVRGIERIALAQGFDLGEVRTHSGWDVGAEVSTDRGWVVVSPCAEDSFSVRIRRHRVFVSSEGWTNDLVAAVGVAHLWRRGGSLRELRDRFPFMSWSELAQAFEDGDPTPVKWRQLLSSEWHLPARPLLQAAHAHPDLRKFWPDISHGSLILCRTPFESESGLAKIWPLEEGRYRVTMTPGGFRREVSSLTAALEVTAACFDSLPGL